MQVDALEGNLRAHKETMGKNFQAFRQKVGELNKQVSTLTEEKRQLEAKVESVQQENGALKASQTPQQPDGNAVNGAQIEELQKQIVCSLIPLLFWVLTVMQDSLRTERDRLLAEKESWSKQTPSVAEPANLEASKVWEAEKAELVKLRDEALEKLKVGKSLSLECSSLFSVL